MSTKYLVTRQPSSTTQVGDSVSVEPYEFFIADGNGKLNPRLPLPTDIPGVWGAGTFVTTFAQLQAAVANATVKRVILGADITFTANVTIPRRMSVVFNGYKFIESGARTLYFGGQVLAEREQIFQGWEAGDITGDFGRGVVYPEWWGMVGSNSTDGQHDIAINCAAKTAVWGLCSCNVVLANCQYWVSKPLDFRGTGSRLIGAGANQTKISSTINWTPAAWEDCSFFAGWATRGQSTFSAVTTADAGASIVLTTPSGGTTHMLVGRFVTISGSSVVGYNGTWEVLEISAHNSVKLDKAFTADATGTVTPVTLDSVMESGTGSASALIWIGSINPLGGNSFFGGVQGVSVDGYYAVRKWPNKRIHGISWSGWAEELHPIKDVGVSQFSGFGIGGENPASIGTTNGVTVDGFWVTAATRRGALPLYAGGHAVVHSFRNGTVDVRITQADTWKAASPPAYELTWPQFGILAAGSHTVVDNIHIEGCGNGVHIFAWDGAGSVSVSNVDANQMMEPNMAYYDDTADRLDGPPPALATQESQDNYGGLGSYYFHHSCIVSIGRLQGVSGAPHNYNSNVSVKNIRSQGQCKYLLRDWVYDIDHDTFKSRFPNDEGGSITSYDRGIPYGPPTGAYPALVVGTPYDKNAPNVDRTYFTLIH